eukprot:11179919-Lingulodinium_polyedra.AAC.1
MSEWALPGPAPFLSRGCRILGGPGQARPGQARPGQARPGQLKFEFEVIFRFEFERDYELYVDFNVNS